MPIRTTPCKDCDTDVLENFNYCLHCAKAIVAEHQVYDKQAVELVEKNKALEEERMFLTDQVDQIRRLVAKEEKAAKEIPIVSDKLVHLKAMRSEYRLAINKYKGKLDGIMDQIVQYDRALRKRKELDQVV